MSIVCHVEPVTLVRKMPSIPDSLVVSHGPSISSGLVLGARLFPWPTQRNALMEIRHTRRGSIGGRPAVYKPYGIASARFTGKSSIWVPGGTFRFFEKP